MSQPYDPTAPEEQPKSGMITRKDVKVGAFVVLALLLLLYPVYLKLMGDRNKHICKNHLGEIMKSMLIYADANTGRFPPAYAMDDEGMPLMSDDGRAATWITVISTMMGDPQTQFECPSAAADEHVKNQGPKSSTLISDFGMFAAMSTAPVAQIANPSQTALIAETSNLGAQNTYDPLPLKNSAGASFPDGFMIGFDNTNIPQDTPRSEFKASKFATRLAFRNTSSGVFPLDSQGRHGDSIHVLFTDGHIGTLPAPIANVQHLGDEIIKLWSTR